MSGVEDRDTQALYDYLFRVQAPEGVYEIVSGLRAQLAAEKDFARRLQVSANQMTEAAEAREQALTDALTHWRDSYLIWRDGCDEAHLDLSYEKARAALAAHGQQEPA